MTAPMRVALYEPEIAGNVGAILRLGACFGAPIDLIEPMGFVWDDRRVRRTAMISERSVGRSSYVSSCSSRPVRCEPVRLRTMRGAA